MPRKFYSRAGEKITKALEAKCYTPKKFSDLIDIPLSTLSGYIRGISPVNRELREQFKSKLGLSDADFAPDNEGDPESSIGGGTDLATPPRRPVPVISWARSGLISERGLNYDDAAGQIDEMTLTDSKDPNAFALIIEGDSMEPDYKAGDRVVISPNEEPRNGNVVVARLRETGEVLIKLFYRTGKNGEGVRLESINKDYDPLEYSKSDFRFIYPVVELNRRTRK